MPKYYEFPSNPKGTLVNVAYANGFMPQTYARALQLLFSDYRVLSLHARPLWDNCPPESLQSWHQFGDDLLQRLDELTDQPVIGIGHSVGAIATMYAAVAHPERFSHLILLDPTLLPRTYLWIVRLMRLLGREARLPLVQQALRRGRAWLSVEDAYTYFRGKRLFSRWSDDQVRTYAESITTPDGRGGVKLVFSPEWEAQIYRTVATDVWRYPNRIKPPLLVICGELTDTFVQPSAALFARLNPRAQIVTIKGAGHLVAQEQPDEVGRAIQNFLRSDGI